MSRLPKGISSPNAYWNDPSLWGYTEETTDKAEYGTNENGDPPYKATDLTRQCQCGAHKTHGTSIPGWYHSDWCALYTKKEV